MIMGMTGALWQGQGRETSAAVDVEEKGLVAVK